jgi:hypothetical protein
LRLRIRSEVAGAARRRRPERIKSRWTAEAATAGTRRATAAAETTRTRTAETAAPAWTRPAESARPRRTARTAIFAGARFAHGERTSIEHLSVEPLNRLFGVGALDEFHERESAWTTSFPIDGQHDLRGLRDRPKVGSQIRFGRAIGQIPDEQADSQSTFSLLCYRFTEDREGEQATRHGGQPKLRSENLT